MSRIAIVSALPQEVAPLCRRLGLERPRSTSPWSSPVTVGVHDVRVGVSGLGACRMERLLQSCPFDEVDIWLSVGFSGALVEHVASDEVLIGHQVMGPNQEHIASKPIPNLASAPHLHWSAPDTVMAHELKRAAAEETGAALVDLELYVVAQKAAEDGKPFAWIRGVTDSASETLPFEPDDCMNADGWPSPWRALRLMSRKPVVLPALIRMGIRSRRIAVKLADRTVEVFSGIP